MAPGVAAVRQFDVAEPGDRAVSTWLFAVAGLVIAMVAVGGATRLTDSGLSITEWKPILGAIPPLSDADWQDAFDKYKQIPEYKEVNAGMSLADFKTIFWWEWGHRFLGRLIGLAYALPLALFWLSGRIGPGKRAPLLALLLLGGLQGFVGWYMVQSGLVDRVDVSHYRLALHLALAFCILGGLVWMALTLAIQDPLSRLQTCSRAVHWRAGLLVALLLAQVILGAFVAGTKAGLTYNTWPLMDGDWLPPGLLDLSPWYVNVVENLTMIQFNHRIMAYVIVALALWQAWSLRVAESGAVAASGVLLAVLMLAQAALGIWTLLAAEGAIPIGLGVIHQTGAAIVFAVAVWHLFAANRAVRS